MIIHLLPWCERHQHSSWVCWWYFATFYRHQVLHPLQQLLQNFNPQFQLFVCGGAPHLRRFHMKCNSHCCSGGRANSQVLKNLQSDPLFLGYLFLLGNGLMEGSQHLMSFLRDDLNHEAAVHSWDDYFSYSCSLHFENIILLYIY